MRRITLWLLWLLVFSIPWEEAFALPGIGTFSRLVGYITLFVAVLSIATPGGFRRLHGIHFLIAAYLLWCTASGFWAMDQKAYLAQILTVARLIGLSWLVWEFAQEEREQIRLIQAYVLGCCVSVEGVLQAAWQGRSFIDDTVRYRSAGMNEDDLALLLGLSIPMAIHLAVREGARKKWHLWLYGSYAVLAGLSVMLTGARGGFLAMSIGLLFFGMTYVQQSLRKRLAFVALLLLTAVIARHVVPAAIFDRLGGTVTEIRTGDWSERKLILQWGMDQFRERPIGGVGCGSFISTIGKAPHNTLLGVLVETGVVGLLLFLAVLAGVMSGVLKLPRRERYLWLSIFLMWTAGGLSVGWETNKTTWLLFGLAIAQTATYADAKSKPDAARRDALNWPVPKKIVRT